MGGTAAPLRIRCNVLRHSLSLAPRTHALVAVGAQLVSTFGIRDCCPYCVRGPRSRHTGQQAHDHPQCSQITSKPLSANMLDRSTTSRDSCARFSPCHQEYEGVHLTDTQRNALVLSQTVSQVCCRWRDVAIETARLWSSIDVPDGNCRLFFEQLGSQLLDIRIFLRNDAGGILNTLCQYDVQHWVSLHVCFTKPCFVREYFRGLFDDHRNLPLERLALHDPNGCSDMLMARVVSELLFDQALLARLTDLGLTLMYIPWRSPAFANLTSLTLNTISHRCWPTLGRFMMILR